MIINQNNLTQKDKSVNNIDNQEIHHYVYALPSERKLDQWLDGLMRRKKISIHIRRGNKLENKTAI